MPRPAGIARVIGLLVCEAQLSVPFNVHGISSVFLSGLDPNKGVFFLRVPLSGWVSKGSQNEASHFFGVL